MNSNHKINSTHHQIMNQDKWFEETKLTWFEEFMINVSYFEVTFLKI